ncbi:MAG: YihY/virulence factor BrkB family protein [Pseudolysinimonas sp.]
MAAPAKAPTPAAPSPPVAWLRARVAWVTALKPVRVVTHYSNQRGPILASGLAFQGIFAVFATLWVAFSIAGLVIAGNEQLQDAIVTTLNNAIPGLIDTDGAGPMTGAVDLKVLLSASVFTWTGAIALVGLFFTALGWLQSARNAVREMFELPNPATNFALLKVRDVALGFVLGIALLLSAVLSVASTSATSFVLGLIGITSHSMVSTVASRVVTVVVMFVLDTFVLATLYRVLASVRIPRRRLWAGALLGAVGLGALKILGSVLLGGASNNPLIASFAVLAGLLIFFNFSCQVILIAAAWIDVGLEDAGIEVDPRVAAIRIENARRLVESEGDESADVRGLVALFSDSDEQPAAKRPRSPMGPKGKVSAPR